MQDWRSRERHGYCHSFASSKGGVFKQSELLQRPRQAEWYTQSPTRRFWAASGSLPNVYLLHKPGLGDLLALGRY